MHQYSLLVSPDFLSEAAELSKDIKAKLIKCLGLLCKNFMHPSLQTKKMKGTVSAVFECRVDQSIRLIYDIHNNTIRCWHIGPHDSTLLLGEQFIIPIDDVDLSNLASAPNLAFIEYKLTELTVVLTESDQAKMPQ